MPKRRFVNGIECRNLLNEIAQKRTYVTLTTQTDNVWRVFKSHFLSLRGNQIVLGQPLPDAGNCHLEPAAGQEVAVSFKKGYNKFLFLTRISKPDTYQLDTGERVPVINVLAPDHIEKIQRRAFNRADVPEAMNVNVVFRRVQDATVQWEGKLTNLSAGGIALRMPVGQAPQFDELDQFEMSFCPLPDNKEVVANARFRHVTEAGDGKHDILGFQFIGLEVNEEGRNTLRRISRAVGVYLRQRPLSEHEEVTRKY